MTEEYRYRYRSDRVLLDYRQFLPDEGPGQAVFLTYSELQMLRNMAEYLHRRETWVSQYSSGEYYDGPDDTDWDMIEALVAEMELKLMPNDITPWGYTDRLAAVDNHVMIGAGDYVLAICTVPDGYIYVINAIYSNDTETAIQQQHQCYAGAIGYTVHAETPVSAGIPVIHSPVSYVLKAGDSVKVYFIGAQNDDLLIGALWGYKMAVPE